MATFAVEFLVRPFGGAILGSIGDRLGRQRVLIGTMLVMGVATMAIGLVPGYATIGWAEDAGGTTRTPVRDLLRDHRREVLAIIAIVTAQTGFGYFYLVFVVSYAGGQVGLSQAATFGGYSPPSCPAHC